ncbi:unnamed protein product, partial [Prorocentrum cordatum]
GRQAACAPRGGAAGRPARPRRRRRCPLSQGGAPLPVCPSRQAFLALVSTMRPHCCRGRSPRVRGPTAPRGEAPGGPAARAQVSAALARRLSLETRAPK